VFNKVGEDFIIPIGEDHNKNTNRARCIVNIEDVMKALGGFLNYLLMKGMNSVYKFYIAKMDNFKKEKVICEAADLFKKPVFMMSDGKSFDSNQHASIL
jgi:hypothetical protein